MSQVVELSDVVVGMLRQDRQAVLNLTVQEGEFLVLIGPNGSGKSVILKLCVGLEVPQEGTVRVFGVDLPDLDQEELGALRLRIGIVLVRPGLLSNMTVYNNVALPLRYHRGLAEETLRPLVMAQLEAFGIDVVRDLFPAQLNQGQLRFAAIARALVLDQELLLLDDPTTGLDADQIRKLVRVLDDYRRHRPLTVIATANALSSLLMTADRVACMRSGRIDVLGRYRDLVTGGGADFRHYLATEGTTEVGHPSGSP